MIELNNLTPLQKDIADKIWSLDGMDSVDMFISTLPRSLKLEAEVIKHMMIAAAMDMVEDTDLAEQVLARIAK
jgi:hypothetical protein